MPATVSTSGNIAFIHLSGDFDFASQENLKAAFDTALATQASGIEIDMAKATFIDSSIIRMFLKFNEAARNSNKSFAIRNCSAHISEIFSIGGFDKIFDVQ